MKRYLYAIGGDPYATRSARNTKANGEWSTTAADMKEALRTIFGTMSFPGEATGRVNYKHYCGYVPGVSLAKHSNEVIQVWSDEPAALEHMKGRTTPHDGTGRNLGLLAELDVTKLDAYLTPVTALLSGPQSDDQALSPLGASVREFERQKKAIQTEILTAKFEVQKHQWALEEMQEGMEAKVNELQSKIDLMNTYMRGWHTRTQISKGKSGTGPYHVFQQRQYLAEEISIIGNFQDLDFSGVEALEKWLLKSGHIWKLLPLERCILVTRVRQERKEYNDAVRNVIYNELNMQNIIWIRDGQNVVHIDVEGHFDNVVFPNKDEFDRAFLKVREHVWKKRFSPGSEDHHRWSYERQAPPVPGTILPLERVIDDKTEIIHAPEDEKNPYVPVELEHRRYKTITDWLDSDSYTEEVDMQLRGGVQDYLRKRNRKSMKFCVMLQGIIDNTNLLQIPKGTDLFDWQSVSKYFVLVYDYTHGLPDKTYSSQIDPYFTPGVCRIGDWVIAYVSDRPGHGSSGKPWLLQVVSKSATGWPEVCFHPERMRYRCDSEDEDSNLRGRRKSPMRLSLEPIVVRDPQHRDTWFPMCVHFVKVPLPPALAAHMLDDRDWKAAHRDIVPLLAQYPKVLKTYLVNPKNMQRIELEVNQ